MEWNKWETKRVLGLLMDLGEAMLHCGAEIHRVEDTLCRLGRAYGAERTEVFAIDSCIITSMIFPRIGELVNSRRIGSGEQTNLTLLEELNRLSRRLVAHPMPPDALEACLHRALNEKPSDWKGAVGSMLAAGGLCLFFGGSFADGAVALAVALLIWVMQQWFSPLCPNKVFFNFVASLVCGLIICGICRMLPCLRMDMIMIGDIMLLIPGIAFTNSVRNMLVGDTMSGTIRLVEALLVAVALACGFMLAITFTGGGLI